MATAPAPTAATTVPGPRTPTALRAANPRLIYCSITGFGQTGPYRQRTGYDFLLQAMGGLMSVTGEGPGRPPMKCGPPVTDITAGILAAMGVLAAYARKQRIGLGQAVETSLFEAGIVQTYWQSAIAMATGVPPGPMGSAHPLNAPYEAFQTRDGWITVWAANQTNWLRLTEAIGVPGLAEDPRFAQNRDRMDDLFETMTAIYLRGEIATIVPALEEIAPTSENSGRSAEIWQAFDERIVRQRNHLMRQRAEPILAEGGAFVAVGAQHLIGAEGLVELFRQDGWTVERLD